MGLLIGIVMMYIHVMAHRGFCIHYFVQPLRWSYEVSCINTVHHSAASLNSLFFGFHDILSFPMFLLPQFLCLLHGFIFLHFYTLEAPELSSPFLFTHCLEVLSSNLMTSCSIHALKTSKLMFHPGLLPQL